MLPLYATRYTTNLCVRTMALEKSFDTLADLGMTGRIGMDAVHKQMPIGPVSGPGTEEINIGDRFFGSSPFDRRLEHRHGGIPVRPVRHPGKGRGAGVIHRREPDPAEEGRKRPGTLNKRPDIGADGSGRRHRPAVDELGIVDAGGKKDNIPWLAGPISGVNRLRRSAVVSPTILRLYRNVPRLYSSRVVTNNHWRRRSTQPPAGSQAP